MILNYKGNKIEVYDSIEDAPNDRYMKHSLYVLIDSGVGGDAESANNHVVTIMNYNAKGQIEKANKELELLRNNIAFVFSGLSPKLLSFVCMVKSINGKECNDLSEDGIKKTYDKLNKLPYRFISMALDKIKKKIEAEYELFFPKRSNDSKTKQYYTLVQQRTILQLDEILGKKVEKELAEIDEELFHVYEPQVFSGAKGVEARHKKNYEDACTLIIQNTNKDPHAMTVFEFEQTLEFLEAQNKKYGKSNKK